MNGVELNIPERARRVRDDAGFSLIEVLIAMALLSYGILSLSSSVHSIMNYNDKAGDVSGATVWGSNRIEEIKRLATNEPTGGSFGFQYLVETYPTAETMTAPDNQTYTKQYTSGQYTQDVTLEVYPSSATETFTDSLDIQRVMVTVVTSWTASTGNTRQVELSTVLHRRQFIQ